MQPDLVEVAPTLETCRAIGFDHHQRHTFRPFFGVGFRGDDDQIGVLPVGNKRLLSGQTVGVALADRFGLDRLHIRTCRRFCHCQRADQFARNHLGQPAFFLLLGAIGQNIMRHDTGVDRMPPTGQIGARPFDQDRRLVPEIATGPAVFFRD